jgi:hypothetical protein
LEEREQPATTTAQFNKPAIGPTESPAVTGEETVNLISALSADCCDFALDTACATKHFSPFFARQLVDVRLQFLG